MPRQIIINATPQEARVAITENARLLEIFIERARERGLAGSIYKGRVLRVLPGMQAAFIDIGLPKAVFLHASDFLTTSDEEDTLGADLGAAPPSADAAASVRPAPPAVVPIEERLRKGQEVIVQIAKEPIGTKGARVTSSVSLAGRYLVYLPLSQEVRVSRRIESEAERQRLKEAIESVDPTGGGVIVRTACEGVTKREIQSDLRLLRKLWSGVVRKADSLPAPALLHHDLDVILRTIRDLFTADVSRVLVDNRRDYQRIVDFVESVMPRWRARVELYEHPEPIFERYGVEAQIARALERKVWLKSGGYIVIDQTEALTTVDVNTGRYVGKTDQHDTVLRTNLDAARVIVDQLRLRNIGGLIVIDFIDMQNPEHRKAVLAAFAEALKADKARSTILGLSELGLLEMTRKRTRESLERQLCEPCPTCAGRGRVKATATIAYELLRRIRREAIVNAPVQAVSVDLHPAVAVFLRDHEGAAVREIERELGLAVTLREAPALTPDRYEIVAVPALPSTSPPAVAPRSAGGSS
jgi:ribonuclease G